MKRRLATLLTCALVAFGQRSRPAAPPDAPAPHPLVVDAVALDATGHPVADLTAEDFEVVQGGGARKITNFTWFDTRLHTAVSRPGESTQLPALDLLPDEIRRNLVVVVDDLGLTPGGINAVRGALRAFLGSSMWPGDRMAILRSSGGSGVPQQLTGDTRTLAGAIDGIRYLGGGTSAGSAGSALWLTLGYALDGLRDFPGRKVVVLFSEKPETAVAGAAAAGQAAHAAQVAAAAVYAIDPLSAAPGGQTALPSAMKALARDTGGGFGGDFARVLETEQGYYAIGFQAEDSSIDASGRRPPATPAVLQVRRPGVVVRSRAGFLSQHPRFEFPAPVDRAELLHDALRSPFAGSGIRAGLTAVFSEYSREGPSVDATVHFDPRDFSFIHDLQDMYQGTALLWMAAYTDAGRSTGPLERDYKLTLRPDEYRYGLEYGLRLSFHMTLPAGPGAWQIRVLVADGASDRIGSATQFVETPNVRQGGLALSGLILSAASAAADRGPAADPRGDSAVRIFKPGQGCTFLYSVFNALADPDKQSVLEVQMRIFADGRLVMDGKPGRVTFDGMPGGSRRQINGQLKLDPLMAPGDYILQVTVRDLLAPPGQPRRATQFTDFRVRE